MPVQFDFRKRLGEGYFGEVWLAKDVGLNSACALKCIPQNKIINQDNFFQEAQILKIAEHPNIVQVKDTGWLPDGRIYVAMEYLSRGSLEDEAKGAYVHLSRAKKLMIDVLRGLEHAHSKGIKHRDIKPANILIGRNREGKLSDFGLALPDFATLNLAHVKQYQYFMHLAPEVSSFTDYTSLSDIYACGVTLYRLINGDSFIPHLDFDEMRQRTRDGFFPDRTTYRAFVPKPMRTLINKAMAIDPGDRYQTAQEMRHALEQVGTNLSWTEKKKPNGIVWLSRAGNLHYIVSLFQVSQDCWCIESRKGKELQSLRKVTSWCQDNLSREKAERAARRLLQDLVLGKVK